MNYKIIIIILICAAVIAAAAVCAVKAKKKKTLEANAGAVPMPEVSKDTLSLVNDVYDEVRREKEEAKSKPCPPSGQAELDILLNDIAPELLNDLDPELLSEITSSDYDGGSASSVTQGHDEISSLAAVEDRDEEKTKCVSLPEDARAYLDNDYYLKGRSFSDRQIKDTFIAMSGNDVRLKTDIDSKNIEVVIKDANVYLVNPAAGKYMEMSKKLMKMLGKGEDDFDFSNAGVSQEMRSSEAVSYPAYVDGAEFVCYELKTQERVLKLYVSSPDSKLKLVMNYDTSGVLVSALRADEFIPHKGADYINLDSLKKTGMMAFFSDML